MSSVDKFALFLKLTQNHQSQLSRQSMDNSNFKVVKGKSNPNSESYKKLHQSSEIFKENATPIKINPRRVNEASQRKYNENLNSGRILNNDKYQSPLPKTQSATTNRYNVNAESQQKDIKRILKTVVQKEQDFNHRINLPISQMQVKEFKEDNYGLGNYRTHQQSHQVKIKNDYSSKIDDKCINNIKYQQDKQAQTERYSKKKYNSQNNLLTSDQLSKTDNKNNKKLFAQSIQNQQISNPQEIKIYKPQNRVFLESQEEVWEQQYKQHLRRANTYHLDLFKSQLRLLI